MSSSNKTPDLQLSQFIGTDIPSILTDYNDDMRKIDTGVLEVKQATAGAVGDLSALTGRVTNNENDISTLNNAVNDLSTRVTTNENEISTINDSIESLNNKKPKYNLFKWYSPNDYNTYGEIFDAIANDVGVDNLINAIIRVGAGEYYTIGGERTVGGDPITFTNFRGRDDRLILTTAQIKTQGSVYKAQVWQFSNNTMTYTEIDDSSNPPVAVYVYMLNF